MKDYQDRPIPLDTPMMEFLEEAARQYDLGDVGKAMRCLVNYARENPDKRDEIFAEIRCVGC